jgi:hypothetical protein
LDPEFDRSAPAQSGVLMSVAPDIRRIIANNPSPFTFTGTCTYVVGRGDVTVIDPARRMRRISMPCSQPSRTNASGVF